MRLQLRVVTSLLEQGVAEWSELSTVKLKASQLSLGLNPEKLPKNISFVKTSLNIKFLLLRTKFYLCLDHPLVLEFCVDIISIRSCFDTLCFI